jgi:HD superfamily phosphohydrolase
MDVNRVHEIRDPVHVFIKLDTDERRVLDSSPVQRLRHIHQLAMSYLVYPGATHKRFEHSLGVMELAGRVFDVVTDSRNLPQSTPTGLVPSGDTKSYWRKVVRMAALCHDLGHLPFSHAAEHDLLPKCWSHERISHDLILGDELASTFRDMRPPLIPEDVAKISVGPKILHDTEFSTWHLLLSNMISGDALGVDRMDYLLRDSLHTGVGYGRFDHYRLVDTMRLLTGHQGHEELALGVEIGGIHSAEALLLARYFMFMQVYHHPVRVAYDLHLKDFLQSWLDDGQFPIDGNELQKFTDNLVLSEIAKAAEDPSASAHESASRIVHRRHFRVLYVQSKDDVDNFKDPVDRVYAACVGRYGPELVHQFKRYQDEAESVFPVLDSSHTVTSSHLVSGALQSIPLVNVGLVLIAPEHINDARRWFNSEREAILSQSALGDGHEPE